MEGAKNLNLDGQTLR